MVQQVGPHAAVDTLAVIAHHAIHQSINLLFRHLVTGILLSLGVDGVELMRVHVVGIALLDDEHVGTLFHGLAGRRQARQPETDHNDLRIELLDDGIIGNGLRIGQKRRGELSVLVEGAPFALPTRSRGGKIVGGRLGTALRRAAGQGPGSQGRGPTHSCTLEEVAAIDARTSNNLSRLLLILHVPSLLDRRIPRFLRAPRTMALKASKYNQQGG